MWNCKYCNQDFEFTKLGEPANHSRWCAFNPKRDEYNLWLKERREDLNSPESIAKRGLSIKQAWKDGKYDNVIKKDRTGFHHTEETKRLMSEKARASNHRRLRKGCVWYKGVLMDSSWEVLLAERLDSLNIKWTRPDSIEWIDDNDKKHNYFPDFYLPDYNLFLDPKNPYAYKVQLPKIIILIQLLPNLRILKSIKEINEFIP